MVVSKLFVIGQAVAIDHPPQCLVWLIVKRFANSTVLDVVKNSMRLPEYFLIIQISQS